MIEQKLTVLVTVGDSFLSIAAVCNLLASEMFDGDQCDFLRVQFCVAFYFLAFLSRRESLCKKKFHLMHADG